MVGAPISCRCENLNTATGTPFPFVLKKLPMSVSNALVEPKR